MNEKEVSDGPLLSLVPTRNLELTIQLSNTRTHVDGSFLSMQEGFGGERIRAEVAPSLFLVLGDFHSDISPPLGDPVALEITLTSPDTRSVEKFSPGSIVWVELEEGREGGKGRSARLDLSLSLFPRSSIHPRAQTQHPADESERNKESERTHEVSNGVREV